MNQPTGMTLLIVDDDPNSLHSIYQAIEQINDTHNVIKAINGEIALKVAKKHRPDLIITDWEMPEMDGITLIRELQAHRHTRDIPVIMCTGVMTSSENLQTALDAGAIDYVRKPVDPIELRARMQSVLRLSESFREIKRLNETKDRIFSIIAHDLRSPINLLQGILTIFQLGGFSDPEELKKMMNNASMNVQNVSELLDNLLSWARIQIQREDMQMKPREINLNTLIQDVVRLYQEALDIKDIQTEIAVAEENARVWADPDATKLVLRNLISNATKFTPKQGNLSIRTTAEADGKIKLHISDTGMGMNEALQQQLFGGIVESRKGTEKEQGTGLGLMLCKDFITWNGGEIGVESQEGKGSTFWITLPRGV